MNELKTKQERINQDPLAKVILSIIEAMKADYGTVFSNQFKSEEDLTQYKRRLYKKLIGIPFDAIFNGYEELIDTGAKYCPTVPELLESIQMEAKKQKRAEINRIEAERVSSLPPPTITCDPVKMFGEAKEKQNRKRTRAEMDAMIENHRALLIIHADKIRSIKPNPEQLCKYGMCDQSGTLSRSTRGDGNFYCYFHWRMAL